MDTMQLGLTYLQNVYQDFTKEDYQNILAKNWFEGVKDYQDRKRELSEEQVAAMKDQYHSDKEHISVFPGVREALEGLADDYLLTLNTSASDRNTHGPLGSLGLLPYFDWVGTCDTSFSKVDKFKMIQEKFSLNPEDCLFITDTVGDLAEAYKAGIKTVGVTWGAHHQAFFEKAGYENLVAVIDSPDQIVDTVQVFFNHET